METFFSFLDKRIDDCSSRLCLRLEPGEGVCPWISQAAPYAAAFRLNAGDWGNSDIPEVVAAIQAASDRRGSLIPVIWEMGNGIPSSAEIAAAQEIFSPLRAAALGLSVETEWPTVEPFLANQEKGALLRCEPGKEDDPRLMQVIQEWGVRKNVGLALGEFAPEEMTRLRWRWPSLYFLLPESHLRSRERLERVFQAGRRADGKGVLFEAPQEYVQTAKPAVALAELRDEMMDTLYRTGR